jgi:hypothetical protein
MSIYVAFCRPPPGAVVTYLVTGFRTTSVLSSVVGPGGPRLGMTSDRFQAENGSSWSVGVGYLIFLISRRCGKVNFGGRPPWLCGPGISRCHASGAASAGASPPSGCW